MIHDRPQFKHIGMNARLLIQHQNNAVQQNDSQIVSYLKKFKQKDQNLHRHLCQLLTSASSTQLNGLSHFQRLSDYFKKVKFDYKEEHDQQQVRTKNNKKTEYPSWLLHQQQILKKLKKSNINSNHRIIQNFQKKSQILFEPSGISFGQDFNFKINTALSMIAEKQNAVSLRFWGKILTTSADYLIVQGICKKNKQPIASQGMEKYRQGVNYYSFWVCQQAISNNWYQLPMINAQQLKASRQIKHLFTGRLGQEIRSYPKFIGQERHLLKCQLVRITHNCEIVPNGLYTKMEQNPDQIDFSEQFKMPQFNDLANLQNWVHLNPYILGVGRFNYYKDPKLSPEQNQQVMNKLAQTDPRIQRLKGINEDKPIQKLSLEICWASKQIGNLQVFNGKQQGSTNVYGLIVLKNPHWPGWRTVANSKMFGSIYVGYGYKLTQQCFYPPSPVDLQMQGQQVDEIEEPNPRNPPDQLEPDSDQQNKKNQQQ